MVKERRRRKMLWRAEIVLMNCGDMEGEDMILCGRMKVEKR